MGWEWRGKVGLEGGGREKGRKKKIKGMIGNIFRLEGGIRI